MIKLRLVKLTFIIVFSASIFTSCSGEFKSLNAKNTNLCGAEVIKFLEAELNTFDFEDTLSQNWITNEAFLFGFEKNLMSSIRNVKKEDCCFRIVPNELFNRKDTLWMYQSSSTYIQYYDFDGKIIISSAVGSGSSSNTLQLSNEIATALNKSNIPLVVTDSSDRSFMKISKELSKFKYIFSLLSG